jgi:hypothetical protein
MRKGAKWRERSEAVPVDGQRPDGGRNPTQHPVNGNNVAGHSPKEQGNPTPYLPTH